MADQGSGEFLVEPPAPNELRIAVGEQVGSMPEIRQALDKLLAAMGTGSEVEGFGLMGSTRCPDQMQCSLNNCVPVISGGCFTFQSCKIG